MNIQSALTATTANSVATAQVLLVGDWQQRELAAALSGIANANSWPCVASVDDAYRLLGTCDVPPELVFLAQPLPGRVSQTDVDHLQRLAPLARIVVVVGSWCEGELRTGSPPVGVIRLYWYDLATWWQAATQRQSARRCPLWSLPLDHPQAGRWSSRDCFTPSQKTQSAVLVDTLDYSVYETLSAALAHYNLSTTWQRSFTPISSSAAGIWDGGQLGEAELAQLARFCTQVNGPVVALLDFPRIEHIRQAQSAGAAQVFAKPYIVEELAAALLG